MQSPVRRVHARDLDDPAAHEAPRWLVVSGYAVAILLLVTVGFFPWVELVFPSWVFALSLYVLIAGLRRGRVEGP